MWISQIIEHFCIRASHGASISADLTPMDSRQWWLPGGNINWHAEEKKSMFHPKEVQKKKTHRSALARQKPMFHRDFVLIWNKNRDTARFWRNWYTKIEMTPETFPQKSTPRTEYSYLYAKSGKKRSNVGFWGTNRCLKRFFSSFFCGTSIF